MSQIENVHYQQFKDRYAGFLSVNMLTERESQIVYMILQGKSNKAIAEFLYIAVTTVKKHIYNVFNKTGVGSRLELACSLNSYGPALYALDKAC